MSQENVEIVRQMWEAFSGDDPASGLSFCDSDIEWDGTNLPDGTVARGHEAIVEHAMRWAEMWDEWRMEPERVIDAEGDRVILVFREIGRTESGLQIDERHAELYAVREGKVVYRKGFSDPADALEAAGCWNSASPLIGPPVRGPRYGRGADRNRTGVNGFAGRCVTTPPRRRGS